MFNSTTNKLIIVIKMNVSKAGHRGFSTYTLNPPFWKIVKAGKDRKIR